MHSETTRRECNPGIDHKGPPGAQETSNKLSDHQPLVYYYYEYLRVVGTVVGARRMVLEWVFELVLEA